ncbi:kynurenine 3-monooxygenase [Cavenderia fasciculata]|uniref:Kynurenine 3-monooxygenase n=1 Tax=Cavenderia fasciculata TaxID=261658 RepID=F4PZP5_CACFS|nr:kynurenine 3-monooxygenase [Cavenderia fasciculata]EGG18809.1 kynurenine 3-monooxygenase [Cavenderia fasciculata]|eukprot:XP_004357271.1 kynurenine 3-monooxygenase [Cavenderia fasciculata]
MKFKGVGLESTLILIHRITPPMSFCFKYLFKTFTKTTTTITRRITTTTKMIDNEQNKIAIIGAGLAGCAMAVLLAKQGFNNIDVFEKRPLDVSKNQQRARSINLALSARGIATLQEAGVMEDTEKIAIPMKGRMIHTLEGASNYQAYSSDTSKHLYSISRQLLNERLRTHAMQCRGLNFYFDKQIRNLDLKRGQFQSVDNATGETLSHGAATVIGADGAFSAVRQSMTKLDRQEYSQSFLEHGYKELSIPAGPNGTHLLEKNCLHIWPRRSFMMIALPNIDGSFTCTLFFAFDGEEEKEESFAKLGNDPKKIDQFFRDFFPDAHKIMPTLVEDFIENPTSSLVTVKTSPWHVDGKAVLVGDAAHAIVPFYGQGMNAAFEDCLDLYHCIKDFANKHEHHQDVTTGHDQVKIDTNLWKKAYQLYQLHRKANSDAIAEMAVENFYEMRDHVADPIFLFKKKLEHLLEDTYPGRYISRYELISFSCVPYADAQRIGIINQQILSNLVNPNDLDLSKIDLKLADKLIKELLNK